jgi:phenylalanyl-tRNA synthetase beta chain
MGLSEIQTYSFVSPKGVDKLSVSAASSKRNFVKLINPLGEENSVMRTVLLPNVMDVLSTNNNRSNPDISAFEIGNTFLHVSDGKLPEEKIALSIGAYGGGWDFFTLKGVVVNLLKKLGIKDFLCEAAPQSGTYHPGRSANLVVCGKSIGLFGEVHPDVRATYGFGVNQPVYAAELDFDELVKHAELMRYYSPLHKYPSVTRDISLLADEHLTVGEVERIVNGLSCKILENIKLFDVYRGKQIPDGMKSLSFSLTYRDEEKTLTDEDVAVQHEKILQALTDNTGATLREV